MKKKRVQTKTCIQMGLIGVGFGVLEAAVILVTGNPANPLRAISLVMLGAMLLFIPLTERGEDKKSRRTKLFCLFIMLMIAYLDLPLLCPLLEAMVLPLFLLMYRQHSGKPQLWTLVGAEVVYMVVRTLVLTSLFGGFGLRAVGVALLLVSAVRIWVLWGLYGWAKTLPQLEEPPSSLG